MRRLEQQVRQLQAGWFIPYIPMSPMFPVPPFIPVPPLPVNPLVPWTYTSTTVLPLYYGSATH
jgi:hypothetical protein